MKRWRCLWIFSFYRTSIIQTKATNIYPTTQRQPNEVLKFFRTLYLPLRRLGDRSLRCRRLLRLRLCDESELDALCVRFRLPFSGPTWNFNKLKIKAKSRQNHTTYYLNHNILITQNKTSQFIYRKKTERKQMDSRFEPKNSDVLLTCCCFRVSTNSCHCVKFTEIVNI